MVAKAKAKKSKKPLIIVLCIIVVLAIAIAVCTYLYISSRPPAPNSINLYTTNDVHGGINNANNNGLSYYSASKLKENDNATCPDGQQYSFLIDAGDHTAGSAYATYDNGSAMVKAMRYARYDFAVPGNHEFDLGPDRFKEISDLAKSTDSNLAVYNYYACNFWSLDQKTQEKKYLVTGEEGYKVILATKPWNPSEFVKIALVGIMTPETISKTAVGFYQDEAGNWKYKIDSNADNLEMAKVVNNNIKKIKDNNEADIVIGVGHLGIDEVSKNDRSVDLIKYVNNDGDDYKLDAFIDGHSHHVATEKTISEQVEADVVPDIPYIQTGTAFQNIGKMSITEQNGKYVINTELIDSVDDSDINSFTNPVANASRDHISQWIKYIGDKLEEKVGICDFTFYDCEDITKQSKTRLVRKQETNLTDLVADAVYWYSNKYGGCDCAFFNGGGIRKWLDQGEVKMLNCFDTTPYQNQLAIADVPGKVLLDALEFSTRNIEKSDFGGFLQPSGIKFDVNTNMVANIVEKNDTWQPLSSNPDNYRVNNVKIYNKRNECYEDLDLNKTYKVAGLDYYFKNYGDGYLMFRNADVKVKSYTDISATMLKEYLQNFKKANGEELAHINSKNSPLYGIKDFGVNYENKYGSGRINIK